MIPENYLEFIRNTRYYLKSEIDCFLVHAGLNFHIPDPLEDKKAMVWKRDIKYDEDFLSGRKLIHGHTPQPLENIQLQLAKNSKTVNLDAGCVYKNKKGLGNLVALNLDQWRLLVQENID
ncbi:MAG: hypothetical protein U5Q03_01820 [Bacteroidota bacterium]|nr:hypothetical protein [Bacteroidota bacterium]